MGIFDRLHIPSILVSVAISFVLVLIVVGIATRKQEF